MVFLYSYKALYPSMREHSEGIPGGRVSALLTESPHKCCSANGMQALWIDRFILVALKAGSRQSHWLFSLSLLHNNKMRFRSFVRLLL